MDLGHYIRVRVEGQCARVDGEARCVIGFPLDAGQAGGPRRGLFAEWVWDGQQLVVRNDRYGFYPLFHYQDDRQIVVSDSIAAMIALGVSAELDLDALSVFLRLETFVGEDTPFRRIHQLPPGAELVWSRDERALRTARPAGHTVAMSRSEAVDGYVTLFRQAVRRRLPGEGQGVIMPLSGGQDSRHILLELIAQGCRPVECVSVTRPWQPKLLEDARVAAVVCGVAGVPHRVFEATGDLFTLEVAKNLLTNFCTFLHGWYLPFAAGLTRGRYRVYDGIAGDMLSVCYALTPERFEMHRKGEVERLAGLLFDDESNEQAIRRVLDRGFYASISRERAEARLGAELSRHVGHPNPLIQFYFWNRTRRAIAPQPLGILGPVADVACPFLDDELYDFLSVVPPEIIMEGRHTFHEEAIAAAFPRFADIPYSAFQAGDFTSPAPFQQLARRLATMHLGTPTVDLRMFRKARVVARLVRCGLQPRYALGSHWFLSQALLYFAQVGSLAAHGARSWVLNRPTPVDAVCRPDSRSRPHHAFLPNPHALGRPDVPQPG
jgi:hypothetical protein